MRGTNTPIGNTLIMKKNDEPTIDSIDDEISEELGEPEIFLELYKKELPEPKWVVKNILPTYGISILSAPASFFKTWLLLAISIAVAKGEKVFGNFETVKNGVLIVNEESCERIIQDRIKKLNKEEDVPIWFFNNAGITLTEEKIEQLIEICKKKKVGLIIFDSLTRVHRFSENDSGESNRLFFELKKFTQADLTVLLTHHHRKGSLFKSKNPADELRGSSDIEAFLDAHCIIEKTKDNALVLTQVKQRASETIKPFKVAYTITENQASFEYLGEFSIEDERANKIQENKEPVLEIIKENAGITRQELFSRFKGKIGQLYITNILTELARDKVIYSEGKKPKKYYFRDEDLTLGLS